MDNKARIIPSLSYENAKEAIQWLRRTFDFKEHAVHLAEGGKIAHAQLTYKDSMVMIGSADSGSAFSKLIKRPSEIEGFVTQSPYIIIDHDEIEAHYDKAKINGAEILLELKSEDYGGKNYTCRDLEGHIWNFGSFDPWEGNDSLIRSTGYNCTALSRAEERGPLSLRLLRTALFPVYPWKTS